MFNFDMLEDILTITDASDWKLDREAGTLQVWGIGEQKYKLQKIIDSYFNRPINLIDMDEERHVPIIKYTPEEIAEKSKDPIFKLSLDVERNMYGPSESYVDLESSKESNYDWRKEPMDFSVFIKNEGKLRSLLKGLNDSLHQAEIDPWQYHQGTDGEF